jgi:hypothetical protein
MFTPGSRACGYKTASGLGKWPNRDPLQEKGGMNLYALVEIMRLLQWILMEEELWTANKLFKTAINGEA